MGERMIIDFSVLLLISVVLGFPAWKVFDKAGFPGWYGLVVAVPLVNIGLLYYLAHARWPALPGGDDNILASPTDDERAKGLFSKARKLASSGDRREAVQTLKNLIELFPGTEHANKARKSLKGTA